MASLSVGQILPACVVAATGGEFSLSAQRGQPLVLYFYPRDNTPGCTVEAGQFRDLFAEFNRLGCRIFGVSRDPLKSHQGFKAKFGLPFDLIADTDETLCRLFGVIKTKNMYGKQVVGIERSTFLFDAAGCLVREWRGVKVNDGAGHAAAVLAAARELSAP